MPNKVPTKDLVPVNREENGILQVILTKEEMALFKAYSEATEMAGPRKRSMSEIAKDFIALQLWRQTECCEVADEHVRNAMAPDPRQGKDCWGFKCNYCTIQLGCMRGEDPRTYLPTREAIALMKPAAKAQALTLKGDEFVRNDPNRA